MFSFLFLKKSEEFLSFKRKKIQRGKKIRLMRKIRKSKKMKKERNHHG